MSIVGWQVAGYAGLLLATPTVLYEIIAYVVPGLTKSERRLLAPVIFGSSILFYLGCAAASAATPPPLYCQIHGQNTQRAL
jgi:sec-independent protein translocase protein TatC